MNHFSSSSLKQVSKSAICDKMSVSSSSIYYQPRLPAKDLLLKQQIEAVLLEHKAYGYRRVAIALNINRRELKE